MDVALIGLVVLFAQSVHIGDSPKIGDGNIVSPPEILFYTDPFYTRIAREKKVEGTVTIEGAFDVNGCMKVVRTIKTIGLGLDEKALEAVRSWRFSPAKRNGEEPVEAHALIDVDFRLAAAPRAEYDDIQTDIDAPGISAPMVIKRVVPQYTDEAKQERVVGTVILQTVIQTNGTADIVKVVKPMPFGLTESALEALQEWRFMPAVRNGKEIPVAVNIEIAFNIEQSRQNDVCR
jgi:TonB family protein